MIYCNSTKILRNIRKKSEIAEETYSRNKDKKEEDEMKYNLQKQKEHDPKMKIFQKELKKKWR